MGKEFLCKRNQMHQPHKPLLVGAGVLMLFFLGIIYAWSVFKLHIQQAFPDFTAAELSLNFTIVMIGFALGGFLGGTISRKYSPGTAARVSAVFLLAGFMGTSLMGNFNENTALLVMYICYGALSGLGTGIGYNVCVSNIAVWFPEKLGLISGVLLMGFGFGSLFIGSAVDALAAETDIFIIFRILAVIVFAVLFAGSFIVVRPAPAVILTGTDSRKSYTPKEMIKEPFFWVYFIWNILMSSSGLLVINSAANIAVYYGAAAGLGLGVSLFNGAGRPVVGFIMDKLGQLKGMSCINGILILAGIMLVASSVSGNGLLACAGMFMVGVCYGGGMTISTKVISTQFGPDYYPVNLSIANFCSIPASFIGPYISGVLMDKSGGDYQSTFILLLLMGLINMCVIFILGRLLKKQ